MRLPRFDWLANSRIAHDCGVSAEQALQQANAAPRGQTVLQPWAETTALRAGDVLVDATASDVVADWHVQWLLRGVHVVTANKLGQGTALSRAQALHAACCVSCQRRALRRQRHRGRWVAGVEQRACVGRRRRSHSFDQRRVVRIVGVAVSSLRRQWCVFRLRARSNSGWLYRAGSAHRFVGRRCTAQAADLGACRRLAAGAAQVHVESLVPAVVAKLPLAELDAHLRALDAVVGARWQQARAAGRCLRFVGRVDAHGASVGLRELAPDHPLAGGAGTDNRVAISSDRYRAQPLLIQGPGAGAEVTAAALLDDVLRIVAG